MPKRACRRRRNELATRKCRRLQRGNLRRMRGPCRRHPAFRGQLPMSEQPARAFGRAVENEVAPRERHADHLAHCGVPPQQLRAEVAAPAAGRAAAAAREAEEDDRTKPDRKSFDEEGSFGSLSFCAGNLGIRRTEIRRNPRLCEYHRSIRQKWCAGPVRHWWRRSD
jgi:hypothetical protein